MKRRLFAVATFVLFSILQTQVAKSSVLFFDNERGSPAIKLIQSAKSSIDIEIYTMTDPAVRKALRNALQRGVKTRVIKDAQPYSDSACDVFKSVTARGDADCIEQRKLARDIAKSPDGAFVPFNKAALCNGYDPSKNNCFEHGKLMIIDKRVAMISTGNFDPSNFCDTGMADPFKCNRDYTLVTTEPPRVAVLNQIFENDLRGKPYDVRAITNSMHAPAIRLPSGALLPSVLVSPVSLDAMLALIHSARRSILVQNQYLNHPTINEALMERARAGINVRVLTASFCSFGPPERTERTEETYRAFDQAGVQSRLFTSRQTIGGRPGYLHAKAILVDEQVAWVGSTNGSVSAVERNREFGLVFSDTKGVTSLLSRMMADWNSTHTETWQESLRCVKDDLERNRRR